jgi:outer membrane protein assembly factor BamA
LPKERYYYTANIFYIYPFSLMPFRAAQLLLIFCLLTCGGKLFGQYHIRYSWADTTVSIPVKTDFPTQRLAEQYITTIPAQMAALGYVAASVDSAFVGKDSAAISVYLGQRYQFGQVHPSVASEAYLSAAGINWNKKPTLSFLQQSVEKLLDYFENTGYPFAAIMLDSMQWKENNFYAVLKVDPGILYKMDSLHVDGSTKISKLYLTNFLRLQKGTIYNRQLLDQLNNRINEMQFVEQAAPWQMTMLPTGGVINLHLKPRRVNQINVLVGLAPSNAQLEDNKLLLTGEANINLKNSLGAGETIGINWQQLQVKAPRINLLFQYPYVFHSAFGLDAGFELFKKDSQWVNVNARVGAVYDLDLRQSTRINFQSQQTNVTFFDTATVKVTKALPDIIDISSVSIGIDYAFNNTNYRYNPRQGWDILLQTSAGTKKVKPSNDIVKLKDPANPTFNYASLYDSVSNNSYRLRLRATVNRYFPLGRQAAFKAGMQSGWFQSPNIFRNELFQIGGNKLLRGFDEESIYTDLYSVLTAELRYLLGRNSYFFGFTDGGYAHYKQQEVSYQHTYIGFGLGLAFETGNSVFNITYAAGKRNDLQLNLRQSKIHLGFVNFF